MRYIIFDLDDTLLDSHKQISDATLHILRRLQSMGHRIVINTARSLSFSSEPMERIRPDYAILCGGALIVDKDSNPLFRSEIDNATVLSLIGDLLEVADNFSVQTETTLFSSNPYAAQDAQIFDFRQNRFPYHAQKVVAAIKDVQAAQDLAEKYHLEFTTYVNGPYRRYSPPNTTKATGNRHLVTLTGGSLADVIAFGDDMGDMEMLQEAGVGVLMKNARPELWSLCDTVSDYTCNEDGVARFLCDYFHLGSFPDAL